MSDPRGQPVAGATLRLQHSKSSEVQQVISGPEGNFAFSALEPAAYQLTAEKNGYSASSLELDLLANVRKVVELTLVPSSQLRIQERVTVIGNPGSIDTLPGSAHYLNRQEMAQAGLDFDDIHQVLRQIPGVNITEEEGFGLRPNIGLRGTGSERSSNITLMEDGVLIAPAPYSSPSAYYFPTTGRMEALEVRKGSSQIKHGPRTQGGAINLISTAIPNRFRISGTVGAGELDTVKLHLNAGDSRERFGWLLETYQLVSDGFKEIDGGGKAGFDHQDYVAKFRFNSSPKARTYQEFELKFGYTDQRVNETYLGLTDADFRANPRRRYRGSGADHFSGEHKQYQARYFLAPSQRFDLTTTIYRNDFKRNWYKLQSVSGIGLSSIFEDLDAHARQLEIIRGADSEPGEMRIRANNRKYYSQGVQTVLGFHLSQGPTSNRLEFGARYHEDEEDRFQHEDQYQMLGKDLRLSAQGPPGSQSNRISDAKAWAFFIQDIVEFGRLQLTPGLRYESIKFTRTDYSRDDPERTAPAGSRENDLGVFIPGLGANLEIQPNLYLFGGVHKGFSPPGPGSQENTQAEAGINYELGMRLSRDSFRLDLTTFLSDYTNLLGADTLSSGGSGEGDLFNGGEARVTGVELSATSNLARLFGSDANVPVRFSYTWTDAHFETSFESDFEPWSNVTAGDTIPYVPRHQFYAGIGLEKQRWRTRLETVYTGRMRTEAGQGAILPSQATDVHLVVNLSGEYRLKKLGSDRHMASLYVSLRNLFDRESIVARRPAGARSGLPRTIMGGLRFSFGR